MNMTTWKELNWFKFEGSIFIEEFKGTFTIIFTRMESEFRQSRDRRDQDISNKPDNEYLGEELSWSKERLQKESQILTAMILTVTFRAIQDLLNELLYWSTGQRSGIEKLNRLEDKYQKVGVILSDQKEFDIIKELRLARNSCVHNSNKPDKEYQEYYPKPRWLDSNGNINVSKAQWDELIAQLELWTNELVQRMTENQKRVYEAKRKTTT
ncbi:MAG: hypothetical protein WA738_21785 [Candidatus Angelobacter sp.]